MESHPNEGLLQELQIVHDTGLIPPQTENSELHIHYDMTKHHKLQLSMRQNIYEPEPIQDNELREIELPTDIPNKDTRAQILLIPVFTNRNHLLTGAKTKKLDSVLTTDCHKSITIENNGFYARKSRAVMRVTQHRRHKCQHENCKKDFARSTYLRRHMITHTEKKPFGCNHKGCSRKFSRRDLLSRHQQTHMHGTRFSCPYCYCDFSRADNLRRHTNKQHCAIKTQTNLNEQRETNCSRSPLSNSPQGSTLTDTTQNLRRGGEEPFAIHVVI